MAETGVIGYEIYDTFANKEQPVTEKITATNQQLEPQQIRRRPKDNFNLNKTKHDSLSSAVIRPLSKNGISGVAVGLPTIFITVFNLFYILNRYLI